MKIFDSHAHYDDEKFDGCREKILSEVFDGDVKRICNVGSNLKSSQKSVRLAAEYEGICAAVGVHPSDAVKDMSDGDWLDKVEELCVKNASVRAIGEIGLDYYWTTEDKAEQKKCFTAQMKLAEKIGLPVIIHDREAHGDVLEIMRKFPHVTGVVHSFSGSAEMAKEVLRLGYYISFGGVVTFKNARKTAEVLSEIDFLGTEAKKKLLFETDCPYLTPVPHRGELNRSDYIRYTAEKCGEIMGASAEELCELTYENAMRFYSL